MAAATLFILIPLCLKRHFSLLRVSSVAGLVCTLRLGSIEMQAQDSRSINAVFACFSCFSCNNVPIMSNERVEKCHDFFLWVTLA